MVYFINMQLGVHFSTNKPRHAWVTCNHLASCSLHHWTVVHLTGLWLLIRPLSTICRLRLWGFTPLLQEEDVKLPQLLQESAVRDDLPALLHLLDGFHQRHLLLDHQVGEKQRGRAAASHHTVYEQFVWNTGRKQREGVSQRSKHM